MSDLQIELCPETGICSILRENAEKIDLMPSEVAAIRDAAGDADKIKEVIAGCDDSFAAALNQTDLATIGQQL